MRVLILGGTAEARTLAGLLVERGTPVVSSLAGRVSSPRRPAGEVRIGRFGGVDGLAAYLRSGQITHLVDATHPFAAVMTGHGYAAARATGTPFLRYARPGWRTHPDAAAWSWVSSYDEARSTAEQLGDRPFLTTGRQTLRYFVDAWRDRSVLTRVVEPLEQEPPRGWQVVLDRGPYDVAAEVSLMRTHAVDVLLTKDSGGSYTVGKLEAAAHLGVPVVVVSRPAVPTQVPEVCHVHEVVAWLDRSPVS